MSHGLVRVAAVVCAALALNLAPEAAQAKAEGPPILANKAEAQAQLGTLSRQLQAAAERLDGGDPATIRALRAAVDQAPGAAALATAFAARYPGDSQGLVTRLQGAEAQLHAAAQREADAVAQAAQLKAQQAAVLRGPAQDVVFQQVAAVCRAALDLAPGQPRCTALTAEAEAHAIRAQKRKAAALARAKPPKEGLRGATHDGLRAAIAAAYEAAWRAAPRRVYLEGPAKAWIDRLSRVAFEDLPVWVMVPADDHCRAFHMTFRRHRPQGGRWTGWRAHSSGHVYDLRCPKR